MSQVNFGQSGYVGQRMSINAENAYDEGRKPLSQIKVADLREYDIDITKNFFTWLAKNGYITTNEWHHSGKFAAEVLFYDLEESKAQIDALDLDALHEKYRADTRKKKDEGPGERVLIEYLEWSGSRNHRKSTEVTAEGYLRGSWVHLDKGGKKSVNSEYVTVTSLETAAA